MRAGGESRNLARRMAKVPSFNNLVPALAELNVRGESLARRGQHHHEQIPPGFPKHERLPEPSAASRKCSPPASELNPAVEPIQHELLGARRKLVGTVVGVGSESFRLPNGLVTLSQASKCCYDSARRKQRISEVVHVDHNHRVAVPRQGNREAQPVVTPPPKLRHHWIFMLGFNDLLFAVVVESAPPGCPKITLVTWVPCTDIGPLPAVSVTRVGSRVSLAPWKQG